MARWLGRNRGRRPTEMELVVPELPALFVEVGSFAHGFCDACAWRGPARRSRGQASSDTSLHSLTGCVPDAEAQHTVSGIDVPPVGPPSA